HADAAGPVLRPVADRGALRQRPGGFRRLLLLGRCLGLLPGGRHWLLLSRRPGLLSRRRWLLPGRRPGLLPRRRRGLLPGRRRGLLRAGVPSALASRAAAVDIVEAEHAVLVAVAPQ